MSAPTAEQIDSIRAACTAGAAEIAEGLSRALDQTITLTLGDHTSLAEGAGGLLASGPGLAVLLDFAGVGFAAVLPAASGLTPEWAKAPDATGQSKLSTLAQELGMLLVPETLMADTFEAKWVEALGEAIGRATPASDAQVLPLKLASETGQGELILIWPLAEPGKFWPAAQAAPEPEAEKAGEQPTAAPAATPNDKQAAPERVTPGQPIGPMPAATPSLYRPLDFDELPSYARSLLKVPVPVAVTLAGKRQRVQDVVALAPGSIITFDKPCDAMLEMSVAGCPFAQGDVVKVGEKFGLRIEELLLPDERFRTLRRA